MFSRWCWSGCNWGSGHWLEWIYFRHRCRRLFRYGDYSTPSIKQLKLTSNCNVYISKYFSEDERLVCENVTLALDYKFYWRGNGITRISVTHTVGTISLNSGGKYPVLIVSRYVCCKLAWFWYCVSLTVALTTRYSAVFLNGEFAGEPNSGNPGTSKIKHFSWEWLLQRLFCRKYFPVHVEVGNTNIFEMTGYQVGLPVIAGVVDTLENDTGSIQRSSINLWKPGKTHKVMLSITVPLLAWYRITHFSVITRWLKGTTPFSVLAYSGWWILFHCWEETGSVWGEFNIRMSAASQWTESDTVWPPEVRSPAWVHVWSTVYLYVFVLK